tara:strand:- start:109 stop:987 length:879 start_codon:yes stop_codon:yes gene_type:complete
MATIQTHEIASRRLKTVVAIPWAEPAPAVAVPYPSFLSPVNLKRKKLIRTIQSVELNQYTDTPIGYYSGHYPGSTLAESNLISFNVKRQDLPALDQFTATPAGYYSGFFPGSSIAESNHIEYTVKLQQLPELDQYTETPSGYYSGYYPGSEISKVNRSNHNFSLRTVQELDSYPVTPVPEQPFTAYLATPYTIRQEQRSRLSLLELDEYRQIVVSAAVLPALYNVDILFRRDIKRELLGVVEIPWAVAQTPIADAPNPWTSQADSVTIWSAKSDELTTYAIQSNETTFWTEQ